MPSSSVDGAVLDHVAHAVHRWHDVWDRYATDLGAEWNSGGPGPGFSPAQLRFGNAARIELLQPWDTHVNDFLARFLAANGPGAHHLTFKVADLDAAIDSARSAGIEPVGIDRSDPEWMEAFLHPRQATGVVVQLAQAAHGWLSDPPDDFPTARRSGPDGSALAPATLDRVVHAVADPAAGLALFHGLLGGRVTAEGVDDGVRWCDLDWSGPLGVRLVSPGSDGAGPLTGWLGGRSGRVHHLQLTAPAPSGVRDGVPGPDGSAEVPAGANAGLALVVRPS